MSTMIRRILFTRMRQSVNVRTNGTLSQEKCIEDTSKNAIPTLEPGKFQAATLNKFGSSLTIQNMELLKTVQPNEVLIDVHYCTVNPSDVLLSKNMYMYEPKLPMVLGHEFVGELIQVGKDAQDKGFKIGDKVIALNKERYGGFAEKCVAGVCDIWKIPPSINSLDAVCLLNDYMTALIALERVVTIDENDTILINVGLNGPGFAAADLATNVFKSKVISICVNNDDAALIRDKGVFASMAYNERKLAKHLKEIADEKDMKDVFDGDSGEYFKKVLNCFTDMYKNGTSSENLLHEDNFAVIIYHLSRKGRIIIAGASATKENEHLRTDASSFNITGLSLRECKMKDPVVYRKILLTKNIFQDLKIMARTFTLQLIRQAGEEVLQFCEEGFITPTYSSIIGFHKINDALYLSSNPKTSAKIIIDIKNKDLDAMKIHK